MNHKYRKMAKTKMIKTSKLKLERKEVDGEFYTKGFIATTHVDDVGDKIMKETIEGWSNQINSTKIPVSLHHDVDDSTLIATSVNSSVEKLDDGEFGLFVETHYNKAHPEFEKVHYEIDNDFLTNYSIEYITDEDNTTHKEMINGEWIRVLEPETELMGYGLCNMRKAANKEAKLYKEIMVISKPDEIKNKKQEVKMPEKKEEQPKEPEAPKEEPKEEVQPEEKKEEEEKTKKSVSVEMKEVIANELKDLKKELVEAMEKQKPLIQETKEKKMEVKEIKDYCQRVFGKEIEGKEIKAPISTQWKTAGKLHDYLQTKTGKELASAGQSLPFECNGTKIELKAADHGHIIPDSYTGTQTTWANIFGAYEEYPAELGAVYQPIIINQMNDAVNTWNLLDKVDYSNSSTITFRVRNARNASVGGYTESTATTSMTNADFDGAVGYQKCHQIFSYYKANVMVSGPLQKFGAAAGGIGDVYSQEVAWSTIDLIKTLNQAILGTGAGTAENACLGFEVLGLQTGNLYAHSRTTYTLLKSGGYDNMASAAITLKKMRAVIRTSETNGADRRNLTFICDPLQVDFIKALLQPMQILEPTAGAVGFTGTISLDGVPVFSEVDCNTDDLFLIDKAHTKIGISVPPVYEELGKQGDCRMGIIKTYFNLFCTAPNHNYWVYGLATS